MAVRLNGEVHCESETPHVVSGSRDNRVGRGGVRRRAERRAATGACHGWSRVHADAGSYSHSHAGPTPYAHRRACHGHIHLDSYFCAHRRACCRRILADSSSYAHRHSHHGRIRADPSSYAHGRANLGRIYLDSAAYSHRRTHLGRGHADSYPYSHRRAHTFPASYAYPCRHADTVACPACGDVHRPGMADGGDAR